MKGAVIDLAKNLNTNWCQSWNVSFSGACMSPRSTSAFHSCHTQALGFKRIKAIQNNSVAVIFVMIDMWLDLTHHITTPWSSFPVGSNLFYCPSDCLRSHWCLYTHSQTPSYQLYISAVFPFTHAHNLHIHTQRALFVVVNWSCTITADLQTPAPLTAALGAVATRKHHSAGEEQARSSTQGEATYKQSTTSKYTNRPSWSCIQYVYPPYPTHTHLTGQVNWQLSTVRPHGGKIDRYPF